MITALFAFVVCVHYNAPASVFIIGFICLFVEIK